MSVDPIQKRYSLRKAAGDMHHMPEEDLGTAVDLDIEWPANNLRRMVVEQMEGPTAAEDQKVDTHHADYGNHLVDPLGHDSVSGTKGPINTVKKKLKIRV